jgi:endonuclease YncB( thermonuclease family)
VDVGQVREVTGPARENKFSKVRKLSSQDRNVIVNAWLSRSIIGLAVYALCVCLAQAEILSGKVIKIADGDTLTILDKSNRQHKIRLVGIDAPER